MNTVSTASNGTVILYDGDLLGKIDASFFEPEYWRKQGAVNGTALGRGATWIVRHGAIELVLRHYRRGGMLAGITRDRYLWLGLARTRAYREYHLLADLHRRGLPVPRPVAARVVRQDPIYRADLVTQRIPGAESLAQVLSREPLAPARWRDLGRCLQRLHAAGVWHADLNAHNILLNDGEIYVIDFDRGRLRAPGDGWQGDNLARLKRSLEKLARLRTGFRYDGAGWEALLAGYDRAAKPAPDAAPAAK